MCLVDSIFTGHWGEDTTYINWHQHMKMEERGRKLSLDLYKCVSVPLLVCLQCWNIVKNRSEEDQREKSRAIIIIMTQKKRGGRQRLNQ